MATYAIGDLQGCRHEFDQLLDLIGLGVGDELWLVGDLINRGADSLGSVRRVMQLQQQMNCRVVLGNHDLHFLAIVFGGYQPSANDTFAEMLAAPDAEEIAAWMCAQPLIYSDSELGYVMAHAGVPHIWTVPQAEQLAREVEAALTDTHATVSRQQFFAEMYGNVPEVWSNDLAGMLRLRCITNYLTRMRLIGEDGTLNFSHKGALQDAPSGWYPWFELVDEPQPAMKILFGHWAALDGVTGKQNCIALDTGCVWGRSLTAFCLQTGEIFAVPASPHGK